MSIFIFLFRYTIKYWFLFSIKKNFWHFDKIWWVSLWVPSWTNLRLIKVILVASTQTYLPSLEVASTRTYLPSPEVVSTLTYLPSLEVASSILCNLYQTIRPVRFTSIFYKLCNLLCFFFLATLTHKMDRNLDFDRLLGEIIDEILEDNTKEEIMRYLVRCNNK